jgi:hypothetical protein
VLVRNPLRFFDSSVRTAWLVGSLMLGAVVVRVVYAAYGIVPP